ncbi:hypothetical protein N7520_004040 [Penicillium odoratum]|uniref:uncharacterized protein n=1 Tax=Penicillium odoratum TaxID=1167516 RepID=UPI0025467C60|nr:uncharacterized protein N7520_004040 [Penicillium odoratum]KAJ5769481.1 hypothetical protein N7520_004040 [Penicillium odoratum]
MSHNALKISMEILQSPIILLSISLASLAFLMIHSFRQRVIRALYYASAHPIRTQIAVFCFTFLVTMLAMSLGWRPSGTNVVTFTTDNGTVYSTDAGDYNQLYNRLAKSLEENPHAEIEVELVSFVRLIDGEKRNFILIEEGKYQDDQGRIWTLSDLQAHPREELINVFGLCTSEDYFDVKFGYTVLEIEYEMCSVIHTHLCPT